MFYRILKTGCFIPHGHKYYAADFPSSAAVLNHLGLTMALTWMFAPELPSDEVRPVLTDWQLPPIALWAKVRAFLEYVEGLLV